MKFLSALLFTAASTLCANALSLNPPAVNVRVEGAQGTIYEGPVIARARTITTAAGGTHKCDGTNNGQNPVPGPTATSALDAASAFAKFGYDGTYDSTFEDYFITRIGTSAETSTQFWGLLLNYQFAPVGGCQLQVLPNDEVLWAFDAFNKAYFLKLALQGPASGKVGGSVTFKITDGSTGQIIPNAVVSATKRGQESATSDATGTVTITFTSKGTKVFKAERGDSIRSNGITIVVA